MTITTRDQLIDAMANNSSRILIDKASISNTAAGQYHSLWYASSGQPSQANIATSVDVCSDTKLGAIAFAQQTAPATSYLSILEAVSSNSVMTLEIHDRLMHRGWLYGDVTTAQNVGIDLLANLGTSNLSARKGASDYSDVLWWLEWYTATGSTAVTAVVNVTYSDGSTGNLTGVALAATRRSSQMIPLNSFIPAANAGLYIRGVNTVTLSASTGATGAFGVTATRYRAAVFMPIPNARFTADWAGLGLPEIYNNSCLMLVMLCSTTTTGTLRATGKISHG